MDLSENRDKKDRQIFDSPTVKREIKISEIAESPTLRMQIIYKAKLLNDPHGEQK